MATESEIRAAEARQLLNNPVFQDAFNNVRETLVAQLEDCGIENVEYRNQIGISLQCLAAVKHDINEQIDTVILDAEEDS